MENFTIGQVAGRSGVSVETIRYYQSVGLIAKPEKPASGYRRYNAAAIQRVAFIKRAQHLGFTLTEVSSLLTLEDGESCGRARLLAEEKLALVEERIADLQNLRRTLTGLVSQCASRRGKVACPLIASLAGD